MAQQTAMQKLFTNLESIGVKVPQGIKDIYLQMEKEQTIKAFKFSLENACKFIEDDAAHYYYKTYKK
jgi:hypothetical protein